MAVVLTLWLARDVCGNVGVVGFSISPMRRCIGAPSSTPFCDQQLSLPQLAPVDSTMFLNTCEHQSTLVINLYRSLRLLLAETDVQLVIAEIMLFVNDIETTVDFLKAAG
ncbi:hypothetical protein Tco_1352378 [Tanacetum coccineum]